MGDLGDNGPVDTKAVMLEHTTSEVAGGEVTCKFLLEKTAAEGKAEQRIHQSLKKSASGGKLLLSDQGPNSPPTDPSMNGDQPEMEQSPSMPPRSVENELKGQRRLKTEIAAMVKE